MRFSTTCRRRPGSARTITGTSGSMVTMSSMPFGGGLQGGRGDSLVEQVDQIELDIFELQPIGFDLRQIEHTVDQARARPWRCRE